MINTHKDPLKILTHRDLSKRPTKNNSRRVGTKQEVIDHVQDDVVWSRKRVREIRNVNIGMPYRPLEVLIKILNRTKTNFGDSVKELRKPTRNRRPKKIRHSSNGFERFTQPLTDTQRHPLLIAHTTDSTRPRHSTKENL